MANIYIARTMSTGDDCFEGLVLKKVYHCLFSTCLWM